MFTALLAIIWITTTTGAGTAVLIIWRNFAFTLSGLHLLTPVISSYLVYGVGSLKPNRPVS
jgi:hypothetical protein